MNDPDTVAYIDRMKPVPDEMLKIIRSRLKGQKTKSAGRRRPVIIEWLKIAAAVIITFTVSWFAIDRKTPIEELPQAINTIRVPVGQTVNLTLSDGTNIWLNARTTLKYPGAFTGDTRELTLDGEGFFDVAHDPERPFIVHANGYDIRALGTQFNVEAYSQSDDFSASLLDGSIRVTSVIDTLQTIILKPNTIARLYEGRLVSETISDFDHYRWREGLICFNNIPFTDLMERFEKCYGISIVVQNRQVENYAPTGKFRTSDGIDYALRVLQRNFRFRFERDEDKQVIYIK